MSCEGNTKCMQTAILLCNSIDVPLGLLVMPTNVLGPKLGGC